MTNKVETKTVPDRVLREFGSDSVPEQNIEPVITPDNLDSCGIATTSYGVSNFNITFYTIHCY